MTPASLFTSNILVLDNGFCTIQSPPHFGAFIQELNMSRLIATYRAAPTPANRAKLQAYLNKHMMAVCMASDDEIAFLKANGFSI